MKSRSLRSVAGPLWVENLLRTSLTSVDVFMLSFYSEKAVAAVGLVNQFVFFIQLMYLMVSSGASILLSQYIGAGQKDDARNTVLGSFLLGGIFALGLSLVLVFSAPHIIAFYSLEPEVAEYAVQFLTIYAAGSVFVGLAMLQGTILRTHGHNRSVMVVNISANILNIVGNSLVLFGPFGLPVLGVAGVAISTVVSQALASLTLAWVVHHRADTRIDFSKIFQVPRKIFRQILSVGVPSAGESLSYNLAQMVNMKFIAGFGTYAMDAYVYVINIQRYVFMNTATLGSATQIKVGWWVGAGDNQTASRKALKYGLFGLVLAVGLVAVVNLAQSWIFPTFTKNPEILGMIASLLLVSFFMEAGRSFNVILIPALKGAGDVFFPVLVGIVCMWSIGVAGSWVLGVALGWGLLGIWVAVSADESIRGLIMLWRWQSGKWKGKSFVDSRAAVETKAVTPAAQED